MIIWLSDIIRLTLKRHWVPPTARVLKDKGLKIMEHLSTEDRYRTAPGIEKHLGW